MANPRTYDSLQFLVTSTCEDAWHRHFAHGWTLDLECSEGMSEIHWRMLHFWYSTISGSKVVDDSPVMENYMQTTVQTL